MLIYHIYSVSPKTPFCIFYISRECVERQATKGRFFPGHSVVVPEELQTNIRNQMVVTRAYIGFLRMNEGRQHSVLTSILSHCVMIYSPLDGKTSFHKQTRNMLRTKLLWKFRILGQKLQSTLIICTSTMIQPSGPLWCLQRDRGSPLFLTILGVLSQFLKCWTAREL